MDRKPETAAENASATHRGLDVLRIIVSLGGLVYLLALLLNAKVNRLGLPEAAIFAAILLFNSRAFANIAEMSISGKGIAFKVREVEQKQLAQEDQIKTLYWLIASVATRVELGYLEKLSKDGVADYNNGDEEHDQYFKFEVRRLRDRGLIEMVPGQTVKSMPIKGNLKDFCTITDEGKKYLTVRLKLESVV